MLNAGCGPHSVAFVERRLTQYRVPLFEALRTRLADRNIGLRVLHGRPTPAEALRNDGGMLDWAENLPTRYLAGDRLVWQPFLGPADGVGLVIVSHENKLLHNHLALIDPRRRPALAFFGHGRNLQAGDAHPAREWFKRQTALRADWWFAYTRWSADIVAGFGFSRDRMTVVDNSVDTRALRAAIDEARARGVQANRLQLGLPPAGPLVTFIGSLVPEKRLARLLQIAADVQREVPAVSFAVAGDGPDRHLLDDPRSQHAGASTVYRLGAVAGDRKAALLACSTLLLNPGAVGLGVLDAFAAGLPLITAQGAGHGPEIVYLDSGHNGLVVHDEALPATVRSLLEDDLRRSRLGEAAHASGRHYSVEHMAARFGEGIEACLQVHRRASLA